MQTQFNLLGNSYTLETRQCNKPKCKCHHGHPHGPYWYCNHTKYIGKELPEHIRVLRSQLKALEPEIRQRKLDLSTERQKAYSAYLVASKKLEKLDDLTSGRYISYEDIKQFKFKFRLDLFD